MFDWLLQLQAAINQGFSVVWGALLNIIAAVLFVVLLPFILLYGEVSGRVERAQMRAEVFAYVQENKETLPHERTVYKEESSFDNLVTYGYYYNDSKDYNRAYGDDNLSFGWLIGANGQRIQDRTGDWQYDEKICENWYYFEIHDG